MPRPGRMDDLLEVETRVKELGGASVTLDQTISRDGIRLVSAEVVVVLVSISGKPLRLSDAVRDAFPGAYRRREKPGLPEGAMDGVRCWPELRQTPIDTGRPCNHGSP